MLLRGFRIVTRRYRTAVGEIDLICRRGRLVVFVEVKRRADHAAAGAAVTRQQRARIVRGAEQWLQAHAPAEDDTLVRFDAILVTPWALPRHVVDAWRPDPPRV